MANLHRGRQSIVFDQPPSILSHSAVTGKKEGQGPLSNYFDYTSDDTKFQQSSWEKAECRMQELALDIAKHKAHLQNEDIDLLFAGVYHWRSPGGYVYCHAGAGRPGG